MSVAAGAAAAAAAAAARAIKASGAIVSLEPSAFLKLLGQNPNGLVVHAPPRFLSSGHKYLMGFKGLAFYAVSPDALTIPRTCDVVEAAKIWIPG